MSNLVKRVARLEASAGTSTEPVLVALCINLEGGPDVAHWIDRPGAALRREECNAGAVLAAGHTARKLLGGATLFDDI